MEWSVNFVERLQKTANEFVATAREVSEERFLSPEEQQRAPRIVYHMLYYEREIALPGARRLLRGGAPLDEGNILAAEDDHWEREGRAMTYDALLEAFERTRAEHLALAPQLAPLWDAPCVPDVDHPGRITHIPRLETLKTINHTQEQQRKLRFILLGAALGKMLDSSIGSAADDGRRSDK